MAGDDYGLDPILFLPDTHRPYHDERAFQLALRVGHNLRRRYANRKMRIVILGDWGDYYCTSRHSKDPNRSRDLRFEIESCKAGLREVDAIGADEKHFVAGNHEDNLARYLMEKAPELFNMIKVEELLDLARTGWSYTPYKHHLRVGKLYITHETGFAGATAHTRSLADIGHNTVIGHTHRSSVSYTSNVLGESLVAAMFGWLGDRQKAEYMHRVKTRDWQLGVGVGFMEPSGVVHLKPVPFINYRAEVAGELVVG